MLVRPLTCTALSLPTQSSSPVSPCTARITPRCQSSSHAKLATISGTPSPVRSTTTGAEMACRQSEAVGLLSRLHSIAGAKSPNTGVDWQVTGSNCGKQRPSVGSQNEPIGQSKLSVQGSPGSVQASETQT